MLLPSVTTGAGDAGAPAAMNMPPPRTAVLPLTVTLLSVRCLMSTKPPSSHWCVATGDGEVVEGHPGDGERIDLDIEARPWTAAVERGRGEPAGCWPVMVRGCADGGGAGAGTRTHSVAREAAAFTAACKLVVAGVERITGSGSRLVTLVTAPRADSPGSLYFFTPPGPPMCHDLPGDHDQRHR